MFSNLLPLRFCKLSLNINYDLVSAGDKTYFRDFIPAKKVLNSHRFCVTEIHQINIHFYSESLLQLGLFWTGWLEGIREGGEINITRLPGVLAQSITVKLY